MQGGYERKEERPYGYCIILLIRINRCKNDMKKDKRLYDYNIILLIRITRCKKNGNRKKEATGKPRDGQKDQGPRKDL